MVTMTRCLGGSGDDAPCAGAFRQAGTIAISAATTNRLTAARNDPRRARASIIARAPATGRVRLRGPPRSPGPYGSRRRPGRNGPGAQSLRSGFRASPCFAAVSAGCSSPRSSKALARYRCPSAKSGRVSTDARNRVAASAVRLSLSQKAAKVELRTVVLGVRRDFGLIGGARRAGIAALLLYQRKVVLPARYVGAQADRLLQHLLGLVVALELEVGLAQLDQEGRTIDVERQPLCQYLQCLGRLAALHEDVAKLKVGAAASRVELLRPLEPDDGLVDLDRARGMPERGCRSRGGARDRVRGPACRRRRHRRAGRLSCRCCPTGSTPR